MNAHLASQGCHSRLDEVLSAGSREFNAIGYPVELLACNLACAIETVSDADGVDSAVQQRFALLQECTSKYYIAHQRKQTW